MKEGDQVKYCDCIGSNGYVHFECLEKWIRGNDFKKECEICNGEYNIKFEPLYPGIVSIDFMCLLCMLLLSIIAFILVWAFIDDVDSFTNEIKNSMLYLPIIFTQSLRLKYIFSRKILSYKLTYIDGVENDIGSNEATPLLEAGINYLDDPLLLPNSIH